MKKESHVDVESDNVNQMGISSTNTISAEVCSPYNSFDLIMKSTKISFIFAQ